MINEKKILFVKTKKNIINFLIFIVNRLKTVKIKKNKSY